MKNLFEYSFECFLAFINLVCLLFYNHLTIYLLNLLVKYINELSLKYINELSNIINTFIITILKVDD